MENYTTSEMIVAHLELARELAEAEFKSKAEFTYKLKHPNWKDKRFRKELDQILNSK